MKRGFSLTCLVLGLVTFAAPAARADGDALGMDFAGSRHGRLWLSDITSWEDTTGSAIWCSRDCSDTVVLTLGKAKPKATVGGASLVFSLPSQDISAVSVDGECDLDISGRDADGMEGRFNCFHLVNANTGSDLNVRGIFQASNSGGGSSASLSGSAPPLPAGDMLTGEHVSVYNVGIDVGTDGTLLVKESIVYEFDEPRHGIYRDIPTQFEYDSEYDRVTPLSVVGVDATGGSSQYVVEDLGGGWERIKVGDPDATVTGRVNYTLTYEIAGALNGFSDHDELYWNAVGHEWDVPIAGGEVIVTAPSSVTAAACYEGPELSELQCPDEGGLSKDGKQVQWRFGVLAPAEGITVAVGFEKGAVPEPKPILVERWTPQRAFAATPATSGTAAAVLLVGLGGFAFLFWRKGRDRRFAGGAVAAAYGGAGDTEENVPLSVGTEMPLEFEPPDGIRPGQVGTLIDEVANPLDVTATIVDLAVRRYLVIEEIPKEGWLGKPDWKLTKLKDADTGLLTYERVLLNGLFEDGNEVMLSDLKAAFVARLKKVQESLYADASNRKWFAGRPDKVRTKWGLTGGALLLVSLVVAAILVVGTRFGLAGVALVVTGLVFAVGARFMPRRTGKGTAMVGRVMGFRRFIESPTQTGLAQLDESENVFSAYLPYAIVFGLTEKWAKAFAALAVEATAATGTYYWYHSTHPFAFGDFGTAMSGFTTATAGTIASVPASSGSSGFSGGSSGGGFGGGGGGSW